MRRLQQCNTDCQSSIELTEKLLFKRLQPAVASRLLARDPAFELFDFAEEEHDHPLQF